MKLNFARNIVSGIQPTSFLSIIIILIAISNVSFSQGRRDRANNNFNYNKNNPNDTSTVSGDTLLAIDSTRLLPVDSTARIKFFRYIPEYLFGTKIRQKSSPLLLENSDNIKYNVSFDTLGNVIIREKFDEDDIRAPLVIPLDKYLKELSESNLKKTFEQIVSEKFQGNTQDDISKLFEKFTDITIPLPFKSESIFGPPTFNLKINGAVDITASYQNSTTDQLITTGTTNSNNSINFKQEVQLTAKGKIGDKLLIDADYNTQRLFDFENQLKIKYEGYADEVIKRIEGGNVSLQTNSGLIGSSQALFGVVGDFQLGALSLSAVVSQKKSKSEVKDYSGGSQESVFDIKVFEYSDNHYFLDTIYKASFLDYFNNINISQQTDQLGVDEQSFEVWVQTDITNTGYRYAGLHVDLGQLPAGGYDSSLKNPDPIQGQKAFGLVRRLTNSEYSLNKYAGYLSLKISLPDNYFVGIAYKRTRTGDQFGTISSDIGATDTLVLKMVKVPNLIPANTHAWELKLKNIYRLPVSKVVPEGFEFDVQFLDAGIFKPTLPINGLNTYLLTILGLDKFNNGRSGTPNNRFDFAPGYTIDPENGFVIFPTLKPFLTNLSDPAYTIDSSFWYPQIYSETKENAKQKPNANNYRIYGKAKGESGISNTLNLGFNIVQGSVVVKLGERELVLNSDYTVDYSTGTVTIRNSSALVSKDLKISYETNDLFSLASKTFIGLRGDYKISDKTSLGFTFVNLKQETLNDKVRIGEEPTNNSMFGVDFTTTVPAKFLTNLVNFLPGYNTKEPSSISFRGEIAAITPDPNTKKSLIPQDNNEAVAYIDDMEGAKKVVSLGGTYNTWTMASVPLDNTIGPQDSLNYKHTHRGKIKWYNIGSGALLTDIYRNKDVQSTQNTVTPFFLTYTPQLRGTYNYNGLYVDTIADKSRTWNGVMKYLNTTSNDLVNENINFIEFSMKIDKGDTAGVGKLIFDLGNISQDAIPNGSLNTEDSLRNGELRLQDDLGLDYQADTAEARIFAQFNPGVPVPEDPALDNNSTLFDINKVNGTQNNSVLDVGKRPDTEDLNKTATVRNGNDYFQYEISLEIANNPYIVGEGNQGWRQYKIPLSEFTKVYGNAVFTNINFARMWITGVKDSVQLTMYDINLTGNQWVKPIKTDTTYNIGVVNIEENYPYYSPPVPGDVLRQTVRGQNNVNTKSNEQSLSVEVFNLTNGVKKVAKKDYSSAPIDLFNYRAMKLFVNGDPSFNYTNEMIYDARMVVRFGNDSNNYYEYSAPIHPDIRGLGAQDNSWNGLNDVTVNFNDLTKIKIARGDSINIPYEISDSTGPPGSKYRVFGNPDLQSIREIIVGVEKNRSGLNSSISGSVWFNELRLVNVIDDNGIAFNVSSNLKIADLLDLNFALSKTDPFFHGLDGRIGTRTTGLAWDFSATLNTHKFINNLFASLISEEWSNFITLPVTFRHSENMVNPRYFPGTDIELEKAADERYLKVLQQTGSTELATVAKDNLRIEAQTLSVRNSISISSMQFNLPSNNFLIKSIFNQLRFNFNTDFGNSRDLTYESRDDFRYNGGVSIGTDFGLSDKLNLNIGSLIPLGEKYKSAKMYFFFPFIPLAPLFSSNFSASTDFSRSEAESKQRKFTTSDFTTRDFRANRGFRFDWKFLENWIIDVNGNYDFRAGSDLTPFITNDDSARTQRPESQIFNDIFFNNGLINFGRDLDYAQTVSINPKFNFPYIDKFLTFNANYNVRYGWVNPNQSVNIGYSTSYVNTITGGANLKLQEIFSIFGGSTEENKLRANGNPMDSVPTEGKKQSILDFFKLFKTFVPGDISVSYTQNNGVSNAGVAGLPGFGNFWFYPTTKENLGPSRMYQLGFSLFPGNRAPNLTQIGDSYLHGNELSFSSTINPLFPESVTMSLNFKTNWGFTNNLIYSSDSLGRIGSPTSKTSSIASGNSIFFSGDVEKFNFFYDISNPLESRKNLTSNFKNEIASFPFPNWTLNISGLEKFPFFSQFTNSVSLENNFISEYRESRLIDINSVDIPNAQSVTQAFTPFVGLNFNFKEVLGGNMTSTFRLNKSITNTLNPIGASIQTLRTNEWSVNANFSKTGFSIPLFGLSLQNDITFALSVSRSTNEPINYEFGTGEKKRIPGNGSTITTYNPTVQYSLSSKVSMQFFYKYIKTEPTGQTLTTVPRTTNEGGLNIRITIQ
ncbi:MAG: cell surface protein SprA [bacterium]|nr:cell surface protein SprA [bacterium]